MSILKPGAETLSIWSMMAGGTHRSIAEYLNDNSSVKQAVEPVAADPTDAHAVAALVDLLTRATGNCIGQAVVQELRKTKPADLVLNPVDNTLSIYHALHPGTTAAITAAINTYSGLKDVVATKDAPTIVFQISRMVGRCVGQDIIAETIGLVGITGKLEAFVGGAEAVKAAIAALKAAGAIH
jgi:hypothetical protein